MDSNYIITPSGTFVSVDELYHHGIKGMKWGVRRYQNPDGSLTAKGKKRYLNSDGTLTKKGEKYFAKEKEQLQNEKKTSTAESAKTKMKSASDMDDKELQDKVNRLRNEDAYRDLSKKLGYDGSKTELDAKIASMEKQKRYLELQRDIKNLTPKNKSRAEKIVETLWNKVVEPAAVEVGKNYLKKTLGEAVAKKTKDTLTKEAESIEKTVKDSSERVKRKNAKKEAKKESKQRARQNSGEAFKGTVEGTGTSSNKNKTNASKPNTVIDMEPYGYLNAPVSSATTSRNTSSGRSYVSNYMDTPVSRLPSPNIAGYLPAPKDDD